MIIMMPITLAYTGWDIVEDYSSWFNHFTKAMGHGSAILLGFSFPVFTRVHLQHHIHVNHPKNDPDHIVSTFGPIWLIAPRFFYHEVFFFQRKLWRRYELLQWGIERSIFITIILAGLKFDFMNLIYNLWFGPALMVGVTLGIFFDYLPHRPFRSRNKWINSRVYPSKFMNLLIMGQNYKVHKRSFFIVLLFLNKAGKCCTNWTISLFSVVLPVNTIG